MFPYFRVCGYRIMLLFTEAEDFTRFHREGGLGSLSPCIRHCPVCVLVSPEEYRSWIPWERASRMFPFFFFHGSTVETHSCQSRVLFGRISWERTVKKTGDSTVQGASCEARCDKLQQFTSRLVCKLCRKPLGFHRCSSCMVVDVPALMQRRPGSPQISSSSSLSATEVGFSLYFNGIFRTPQEGALDGQRLLVVEGSGWWGRRESDSQVFCHPD